MAQNSLLTTVDRKEPVLTRQSLATLLQAVAVFYPPIHDTIVDVGGSEALFTTILFIQGAATYFMRGKVTPTNAEK